MSSTKTERLFSLVCARIPFKTLCVITSFAFILVAPFASAQVVVTPNVPAYPLQVLPGASRQINAQITVAGVQCAAPTNQCTVNWSVLSTTGGASATFTTPAASGASSVSAGLATVQVNIGSTAGNCSINGSMGSYSITSPATVTVQAQSVDNPSQTANFLFNVCAKTTNVIVAPAYQQAYQGQHRMLQSWVVGDTDETGTWSIISQPNHGNGVLADTSFRDADFAATTTGRYTLQYTSNSNSSETATAIVYVSPNAMPTYASTSTPNQTEPRECYPDPALSGGDYEVGAGKAYTTVSSVPAITSWNPGTIMRIWNTDTTGSNPSTYYEYFQIKNGGTPTQPVIVCGVPDVLGNLPILDGNNAVGQADISNGAAGGAAAGYGIMTVWAGPPTPYGYWQGGSSGPSYLSITGLHLRNGGPLYNYIPPGGGAPTAWVAGASCVNLRSGSYIDISGNDMDTCSNGFFSAENANSAWTNITQQVTVTGNHIHNSGIAGNEGCHQVYFQSFYGVLQGNLVNNYLSTAAGSDIKWRGVEGIFRYNYIGPGTARDYDLVENQDASQYVAFEDYLSGPGDANCDDSLYCLGDHAGANIIAAYQESEQKDFIYGNEIFPATGGQIHYAADNAGGMADRNGTLYFYSNTMTGASVVFDTGENGDGLDPIYPQRVDARNNIFWAARLAGIGSAVALDNFQTLILDATTNLFETGSISITAPIIGGSYSAGAADGWQSGCDATCLYPLSSPINTHIYDLNSANFLLTPATPFNTTTLVPTVGSAAIGAGSALTGIPAQLPLRWQYSIATSSLLPRSDLLTIGATDETGATPLAATPTFSPAGGDFLSTQTVTISTTTPSANIYYTTDGTTPTYPITGTTEAYSGPITVNGQETVEAIAADSGYLESAVGSATYTVGITATPTISPGSGSYMTDQFVTISDETAGAIIYYTIDGTTPSTGSPVYSGPITVSNPETVQAVATASGYAQSAVGSAVYTFTVMRPTPVYVQQCTGYQQYGDTVSCTFSSASTAGDTILIAFYGAVPVSVTSTYGTPTLLTSNSSSYEPLYAYALTNIVAGTYTITLNVTGNQRIGIAADEFTDVPASPIDGSANGNNPGGYAASVVSGNFNTTQASDLLWAVCFTSGAMNAGTTPIAWSLLPADTLGSGGFITLEDGAAGAAGTYYGQCTSGGSDEPSIVTVALVGTPPAASAPVFSPAAGTYTTVQSVSISSTVPSASYYYTTDGTTPTTGSNLYSGPIPVNASQTLSAITVATAYNNSAVASAAYTINLPQTPTPGFSPAAGSYATAQTVTISDSGSSPSIYYTTNGSTPTTGSTPYTAPFSVTGTSETVQAVAIESGYTLSPVGSAVYTIGSPAATPTFSPLGGTYTTIQSVSISDSTAGATIYYSTNGSTPTTASLLFGSSPINVSVSSTETVEAIAVASSYVQSGLASATYTINLPTVVTPFFSPVAGTYTGTQSVVIATTTPSSTIYYTTNGSTPTTASTLSGTSPINVSVSSTETVEAIAVATGYSNSGVVTAAYTISAGGVSGPTESQACDAYTAGVNSVSCTLSNNSTAGDALIIGIAASGATLTSVTYKIGSGSYVTIPTATVSNTSDAANNLYAYVLSNIAATVGTNNYTIKVNYTGNSKLGLSVLEFSNVAASQPDKTTNTSGGYTTTLTSPSFTTTSADDMLWGICGGSGSPAPTVETTPIAFTAIPNLGTFDGASVNDLVEYGGATTAGSYTVKCNTTGYNPWNMITVALFGASTSVVATPTFSPGSDTYTSAQTVTISDATAGATIYYTTDGSTPSTASALHGSSGLTVTVSATETLNAIGVLSGDTNSPIGDAEYIINLSPTATPTFSPAAGTYTSVQTVTISDSASGATIYYTTNGSTPNTTSILSGSSPISVSVSVTETLEAIAVESGYSNSAIGSAAYTIAAATPTFNPIAGSYGTAQSVTISDASGAVIYYTTNGTPPTTSSSTYSSAITVSANETLEAIATGNGYGASAISSAAYTIAAATPTFSPIAGTYGAAQSVTISDATTGAIIHYTTNGTAPNSGSAVYSTPITVTGAETLQAIATATGYGTSAVGSAAYLTSPYTPVFSLAAGTYYSSQTVSISDATPGATIYYTTDASTPTTSSTPYSAPLSITATEAIEAIAAISGAPASSVTSAIYTIATQAALTTPAPDTTTPLTNTSVTFTWTPGNTATHFEFFVGTTGAGSSNIYNSGSVTATSETVSNLPGNGETLYMRLYSLLNGAWKYTDYTYVAYGSPTQAALTTPAPDTTTPLTNTSVTFTWTPGNTATNFEFFVGTTGAGSSNIYNSGSVTATSETVSNLPGNGETLYMRLYSLINGAWKYTDYTYVAYGSPTQAALTTPAPNTSTPLTNTSVTFTWTPGNTATNFEFFVGTTGAGSSNIYNSGSVTATSETVSNLPGNGETLYMRLYSLINGAWKYTDYTYVAYGSPTQAALTTPAPDTTTPLTNTSVTFTWTPGNTATNFEFFVGTTGAGSSNIYNSGSVTATSETVSNLPGNGETLYMRLYSLINGAWKYTDYTYVAYGSPTQAALTTPAPDTTTPLTNTSVTFTWTPGNTATNFEFFVGTTGAGSSNIYNSGSVTTTSETVSNLPGNGETLYMRLYSLINGAWKSTDYTYVAYGSPTQAALTTPAPNTSTPLTNTSVTFTWTPGNTATHFEFFVGTTGAGSSNIYNSGSVTATSETVSNLPGNGETLYMRLYSLLNGAWKYTDYTYVAYGSPTQAALTTPAPDTTTPLTNTSVTFTWTPGNTATNFEFFVGTTGAGSSNIYNSGSVTATSETVSNLPGNGETLYMRLYSLINGAWKYTDYTYVAYGSPTQAALTTPAPNTSTPLTNTSVTFTWTPGNTATNFEFFVGTTGAGSSNIYNSGSVTATSETVSNLPGNGETLYMRLYSLINGAWKYTDYTYVAYGSPTQAALTTPAPDTSTPLTNTSVTFTWTPGNTATNFEFFVGTTGTGSSNIYNSGSVTATSETVSNLPGNGEKLYMRLYSLINGAWKLTDYTYVAE